MRPSRKRRTRGPVGPGCLDLLTKEEASESDLPTSSVRGASCRPLPISPSVSRAAFPTESNQHNIRTLSVWPYGGALSRERLPVLRFRCFQEPPRSIDGLRCILPLGETCRVYGEPLPRFPLQIHSDIKSHLGSIPLHAEIVYFRHVGNLTLVRIALKSIKDPTGKGVRGLQPLLVHFLLPPIASGPSSSRTTAAFHRCAQKLCWKCSLESESCII